MKCPNCGFETNENYCPMCGTKMKNVVPKNNKTLALTVLSFIIAALVCTNAVTIAMYYNKSEPKSVDPPPTTTASPNTVPSTETPTSTSKSDKKEDYIFTPKKGSTLKTGFGNIKLVNVEYAPANDEFSANYVYTLQKVTFEFENTTDSPKQLGYCDVTIPNDYPNLYPMVMQVKRIEYTSALKVLKSGEKMSVSMVLAVPKKESEVSFVLKMFSSTENMNYSNTFVIEKKD